MFYNKNALGSVLRYEYIGKGFTIGMFWKWFYYKNPLEIVFERILL